MSISCPCGVSSGVSQPDESSASLSVEALGFSSLYAFNCTVCVSTPPAEPNSLCEESGVGCVGTCGSSVSVCPGTLPPTVRRPAGAGPGATLARFEPRACVCVLSVVLSADDAGVSPASVFSVVTMGVTSVC